VCRQLEIRRIPHDDKAIYQELSPYAPTDLPRIGLIAVYSADFNSAAVPLKRRPTVAIYETGGYQVKSSAVDKVKQAIKDFVRYVQADEPGTQMYLAWQQEDDPTRFLHLFIFEDAASQNRHGESEAVKQFESIYALELVGGEVVSTDYELVAGKHYAPTISKP
jgi:quinol monooxygenase YgiN